MYTKTFIETPEELLEVLNNKNSRSIEGVTLEYQKPVGQIFSFDSNFNNIIKTGFHLTCIDKQYDVSGVNALELLAVLLNKHNINLITQV